MLKQNNRDKPMNKTELTTELTEALVEAIDKGDLGLTRMLLANPDLDINRQSNEKWNKGSTPLHVAAYNGEYQIVALLLELGATVDIRSYNDSTPLHCTAIKSFLKLPKIDSNDSYYEIVKLLVAKGADVNTRNRYGETALHKATSWRYGWKCDIIRFLVDSGADVNAVDGNGNSILHSIYSINSPTKIREFLKERGAVMCP